MPSVERYLAVVGFPLHDDLWSHPPRCANKRRTFPLVHTKLCRDTEVAKLHTSILIDENICRYTVSEIMGNEHERRIKFD